MLDAGIAVSYSERDWGLLIDILTCFLKYDGVSAAKLMVEAADEQGCTDVEAFGREIHAMVEMARDEPTFFDKIGECVTRICKAACLYQVKMQAGFASIALSSKVVEAVIAIDDYIPVAPRKAARQQSIKRRPQHARPRPRDRPPHQRQARPDV